MAASIDTTHFSPSANTFDNIMDSTTQQPRFLKMEDLQAGSSPSPAAFDHSTTSSQTSPAPVIVHSKPAKKRKSWGQELPEPKTTLPPRKRAKTDDEKEQRRIERIKRNRAAAHNSRERKRQETDTLAVLLARANAELDAYRKLHGPLPASVVLPEVTLSTEEEPTPAPSLSASRGSIDAAASPASPADTVMSSHPTIKQEPFDLTTIDAPAFDMLAPKSSLPQLDVTQHSAVSVESAREQDIKPDMPLFNLSSFMVGNTDHDSHHPSNQDVLPADPDCSLDNFAFQNGPFDPGFNDSFGNDTFTFDDFLNDDPVTFSVDQAAGAA